MENIILLTLEKIGQSKNSTASILRYKNERLAFVIEDGHRDVKEMGKTRIPEGRFEIKKRFAGRHYRSYKKRFGHTHTFQVMDVPNFSWIMIHIGNTVNHTEGCLLLNDGVYFDEKSGNYIGQRSGICYKRFYKWLTEKIESNQVFIEIKR